MKYENLLDEAVDNGIYVIENADFKSKSEGLINGDVIGINKRVRSFKKRACILTEEMGHYYTTAGNIICQSSVSNRKQELRARLWAYNRLIGLRGIIDAFNYGCRSIHEAAEYLDVTEEFLLEAINCYKSKYGLYATIDNYVIYFEPISVLELI